MNVVKRTIKSNRNIFNFSKYFVTAMESGLAHLEVTSNQDPLRLLKDWIENYQKFNNNRMVLFNLATATLSGNVSNRNLVLRELKEDGFWFSTNGNSKKIAQISKNPQVAACLFLNYNKSGINYNCRVGRHKSRLKALIEGIIQSTLNVNISLEVLIEGIAEKLPQEVCKQLYDSEPLFCKIRSHICQQGEAVEWTELKKKHDALLKEVIYDNKQLEMPDYQVAYKIVPYLMDFYYAHGNFIADRVLFKKNETGRWSFSHIAA